MSNSRLIVWLQKHKPSARASTHLLLAALMWTAVGLGLLVVGGIWSMGLSPRWRWLLVPAVIAGLIKGRFVLERSAKKIFKRIEERGDGRCIGGFQSWGSWMLIAGMMLAGRWLRSGVLPKGDVGLLYVAVGVALLWGARWLWLARSRWPAHMSGREV